MKDCNWALTFVYWTLIEWVKDHLTEAHSCQLGKNVITQNLFVLYYYAQLAVWLNVVQSSNTHLLFLNDIDISRRWGIHSIKGL